VALIYIYKLYNNRVIKIRLDNYLVALRKNGHLMPINPKLYTKCPLGWEGNFVMKISSNNPIEINIFNHYLLEN